MYRYTFYGKIHPQRVNFSINIPLNIKFKQKDFGIDGVLILNIKNSEINIEYQTNIKHLPDSSTNLNTLKNYIETVTCLPVDIWCFVNSYYYDVEIINVTCVELGIKEYTFSIQGEYNIEKSKNVRNSEFNKYFALFKDPNKAFLKEAFADFRRAIKYPAMGASHCFRAIETIRKYHFEDSKISNKKRIEDSWDKFRSALNIRQEEFDEILKFAKPNRHGEYPSITYEERERILNFTRKVIERFVDNISKSK